MMEKNKGGRPLKFKTVEELQEKIDAYFASCYKTIYDEETGEETIVNVKPLTVTGLAVALDTDWITLLTYQDRKEFANTIKKAKARIEQYAEECLFTNKNTAGVIFNMKNNWGWADKQEIESNITINKKLEDLIE